MKCQLLVRWYSMWIGIHYAPYHKRICVNIIPFVTICITMKGGNPPYEAQPQGR